MPSVPSVSIIRLDTSKPYSEVRGERAPDDPHYRVHAMQGRKVGSKLVLLPFDSQGELVPDDGKKEPYEGITVESKKVMHQPLYSDDMRALVARLKKKAAEKNPDPEAEEEDEEGAGGGTQTADDVNLVSWLKGEEKYTPQALRAAAKERYHVNYTTIPALVVGLVVDEKLIPEDQVCKDLARHLPPKG